MGLILLLLLGVVGIVGWKFIGPLIQKRGVLKTSDARAKASVLRVGGDNYLGYWFITSPDMQRLSPNKGIAVDFKDDGGNYAERLAQFANRQLDIIVLPVNVYLELGAKHQFPGIIVVVVAGSKGADALVGSASHFTQGSVKELNKIGTKVGYVPDSPSSFIIGDLVLSDFDVPALAGSDAWRVPAKSIDEVSALLKKGTVNAAMLWEPNLSKALDQDKTLKVILSSEDFEGYVVDVFVVHRDVLASRPDDVGKFFESYFEVYNGYLSDRDRMIGEMAKSTGLSKETVQKILPHFDWNDLLMNCLVQFGMKDVTGAAKLRAREDVITTINSCANVLRRRGKLEADALTNPYLIINPSVLEYLAKNSPGLLQHKGMAKEITFSELPEEQWSKLRELGPLNSALVTFRPGDNLLDDRGKEAVDNVARLLTQNYPTMRVAVRGHTGPGSDESESVALSVERAETVCKYLETIHGIPGARLHAQGMGSKHPPIRLQGEGQRAYNGRLSRVEFVLLEGRNF